jgi:hypothetical protein
VTTVYGTKLKICMGHLQALVNLVNAVEQVIRCSRNMWNESYKLLKDI